MTLESRCSTLKRGDVPTWEWKLHNDAVDIPSSVEFLNGALECFGVCRFGEMDFMELDSERVRKELFGVDIPFHLQRVSHMHDCDSGPFSRLSIDRRDSVRDLDIQEVSWTLTLSRSRLLIRTPSSTFVAIRVPFCILKLNYVFQTERLVLSIILNVSTKKQATTTDTNITLLLGSDGASSHNAGLTSGGSTEESIAATWLGGERELTSRTRQQTERD